MVWRQLRRHFAAVLRAPEGLANSVDRELGGSTEIPSSLVGEGSRSDSAVVLHVEIDGEFRHDNPMFSLIQVGDRYLHLFDLFQLRLETDLVTLVGSAPAPNAGGSGDEVVGLVRGFLYAGAGSVITTLWEVDAEREANFFRSFYERLEAGIDQARALSLSRRELRESSPDPLVWASHVLYG